MNKNQNKVNKNEMLQDVIFKDFNINSSFEELNNYNNKNLKENCDSKKYSSSTSSLGTNMNTTVTVNNNDEIIKNAYLIRNKTTNTTNNLTKCTLKNFVSICCFLFGGLLIVLSAHTFHHKIFDYVMEERLKMTPGLPHYELWVTPKPIIYAKAYIYTVTNKEQFLNGIDKKLKLKEIGPIIYKENSYHKNIIFHNNNSTMSYTIERYLEFLPNKNEENILNKTIIVPNIVLLGMAAYIQNYNMYLTKISFNMISKTDPIFLNTTIYNYLWNLTTPALNFAKNYVPFMIPQDNGGTLHNVYSNFVDRVNVRIGKKYGGEEFFMINSYNDRRTVPGFIPENGDCYADIQNSTEGALYRNYIKKNTILYFWRKTVCRIIPLYFEEEIQIGLLKAYKFIAKNDLYNRFQNEIEDCYKGFGKYHLPNGLSDVSKCYNDLPVAVSLPHFYGSDGYWNNLLEGFTPSKDKHGSYTIIEPITGVPLSQIARSQSNLILPNLTSFNSNIQKFSKMIVPIFWLEYHQETITTQIYLLLIFLVNVLPWFQYVISSGILLAGIFYILIGYMRIKSIHSFKEFIYRILKKSYNTTKTYDINNIDINFVNDNMNKDKTNNN